MSRYEAEKTINLGKIMYVKNDTNTKENDLEVKIAVGYNKDGVMVFSASCTVWEWGRRDIIICGQCFDRIIPYRPQMTEENQKLFDEIYDLWKKHHMNDLHAGTELQESKLREYRRYQWFITDPRFNYDRDCHILTSLGCLYDNGYKYGSGWLTRPIPEDDKKRIIALFK